MNDHDVIIYFQFSHLKLVFVMRWPYVSLKEHLALTEVVTWD